MASEDAHELDDVRISHPAILTCFILLHAQARMITAMPMDNELDLVGHHVDHNLFNEQPDYLLSGFNACTNLVPYT